MDDLLQGIVHGKTVELACDPGFEQGQRVEVVLRVRVGALRKQPVYFARLISQHGLVQKRDAVLSRRCPIE